ncbi:HpcH/HpaI aldolase/citrate lyase family protein [Moraxella marmotae]|uniref:HpcH/HpaI aldolase/citrate lyase family protein n=1 Tax=Moraxella marmotae TaxID=3344520 RepID=UPI0035F341E6
MDKTLFLFVPAVHLQRVAKAVQSGADAIIIDLEDAVADEQKHSVRQALMDFDKQSPCDYWLRINAAHSDDYQLDLAMLPHLVHLTGVLLPKCQNAAQVEHLHRAINKPVIVMIESALGIANIASIAQAQGVWAMSFGRLDLLKSLGVRLGSAAAGVLFDKVRSELLIHSLANGLKPPIETVFVDFYDETGLAACVRHWRDFGFGGQLLIHPKQVAIAKRALLDMVDEQDFARAIYQKYQSTGETVFAVDGKMVDLPLILWAKSVLGVD